MRLAQVECEEEKKSKNAIAILIYYYNGIITKPNSSVWPPNLRRLEMIL